MSVINKMLQDLDRRQALGSAAETNVVRVPTTKSGGHEWFWRILIVLLTAALAWMGWVAVQLMPRTPVVTELAFQAAAEARSRAAAKQAPTPAPATPAAAQTAPVEQPKPASDSLRLAQQLETPVQERATEPSKPTEVQQPRVPAPQAATAPAKGTVADAHFRSAALLLNRKRVSEAEDELVAALRADAAHVAARQAYVALLLEQQRVGVAHRVLHQGLAINPEQPAFALEMARLYVGQREYDAALEVLDRAGPANATADFQAMRATVLQRLGRYADAVEAYQNALRGGTQPATTWVGLGISLEALGRRREAAQAYRRALTAGPIAAETRNYAETRARALE
ncbi:MAG TPA: tetratricopeptide repeat protein [Burkholderiales bacterium]